MIDDAAYFKPLPPPISFCGNIEPMTSYVWLVIIIGIFALPSFNVNTLNVDLTICDLVISLVSLPAAVSSISFVVDNIPKLSNTNINGFLLSSGCSKYLSIILIDCALNSCTVATGTITILVESTPLVSIISFEIALSDSKYITPASLSLSKNAFTIPNAKNVLPVAASPAIAVILFPGIPPYILPDNKALKEYEPVSIKLVTSALSTPSLTKPAYSLPVSLIMSFRKLLIFYYLLIIITYCVPFDTHIITHFLNIVKFRCRKRVCHIVIISFIYCYHHQMLLPNHPLLLIQLVYLF